RELGYTERDFAIAIEANRVHALEAEARQVYRDLRRALFKVAWFADGLRYEDRRQALTWVGSISEEGIEPLIERPIFGADDPWVDARPEGRAGIVHAFDMHKIGPDRRDRSGLPVLPDAHEFGLLSIVAGNWPTKLVGSVTIGEVVYSEAETMRSVVARKG